MSKRIWVIILSMIFIGMLSACEYEETNIEDIEKETFATNNRNNMDDLSSLDEYSRSSISELRRLWSEFEQAKYIDEDPTALFKKSEYLSKLKSYMSDRRCLAVTPSELSVYLNQYGFDGSEKIIEINGISCTVRVISYAVDYYVQSLTDIPDTPNKYIFVQCWNENEFIFQTLSDGDINVATDFLLAAVDNDTGIDEHMQLLLYGYSTEYYPHPTFVWGWRMEDMCFVEHDISDMMEIDAHDYVITSFQENTEQYRKWIIRTNGPFVRVDKRATAEEAMVIPADYLTYESSIDDQTNEIRFSVLNNHNSEKPSTLKLRLKTFYKPIYD